MKATMKIKIARWAVDQRDAAVETFLRRPAFDEKAERAARDALSDVRRRGDAAVASYARRFDRVRLQPRQFAIQPEEFAAARRSVPAEFKRAVREAHRRIGVFARAGMKRSWEIASPRGGRLGEQFVPYERVGVYVPGGAAPLASTVLMTATLAQVAGVKEIVACSPCAPDGSVNPVILHAMEVAGVTEAYRVGGIQAIGMLAYGTRTCRPVQKIVGPGGTYVTAAKRLVYGDVALDLVAGPSEIAVLADAKANPRHVAADLLSQLEHGTGFEKALLVTSSMRLAREVADELPAQTERLSRRELILRAIRNGLMLVVVPSVSEGVELCNRFAPEHMEVILTEPRRWLKSIRCAGAIFLGPWTPESAGDFVAGPSHVLPTGGAAARFSGLTVDDFRRRSSVISFTKADLRDTLGVIQAFGSIEGLDAHARSAEIRFE
jgi:histidinol dehydrogenase